MAENILIDFRGTLGKLMQEAKDRKTSADDSDTARNWALVYTDLQHTYAFVSEYLSEEEE